MMLVRTDTMPVVRRLVRYYVGWWSFLEETPVQIIRIEKKAEKKKKPAANTNTVAPVPRQNKELLLASSKFFCRQQSCWKMIHSYDTTLLYCNMICCSLLYASFLLLLLFDFLSKTVSACICWVTHSFVVVYFVLGR